MPQPVVAAPLIVSEAPRIDGRLDDPAWQNAGEASPFTLLGKHTLGRVSTAALATFDSRNLYIGFVCHEPDMNRLVVRQKDRDGEIWRDDSVEVFLSPRRNEEYYHLVANAAAVQYDETRRAAPQSWNARWRCEVQRESDRWTVEISLPFSQLGAAVPKPGASWNVSFCRNRPGEMESLCFAPCRQSFHEPKNFARLNFAREHAPAARLESVGELFLGAQTARLSVRNPDTRQVRLMVTAVVDGVRQEPTEQKVAASGQESISLPFRVRGEGDHYLIVEARDLARAELIYRSPPIAFRVPAHGERLAALEALATQTLARCRRPAPRDALENIRREIRRFQSLVSRHGLWAAGNRAEWERLGRMIDSTEKRFHRERYRALTSHPEVGYAVGVESPLRKVLRDLPFQGKLGGPVRIGACRGEREPAQVVLLALEDGLRAVEVEATDLRGPGGARIGKERINLNLVDWVKTRSPEYPVEHVGWHPDPLMELEPFDAAPDSLQPLWLTVHVPDDAPAGIYEGAITIAPENLPGTSVPVIVEVWDFSLPPSTRLKTAFALDWGEVATWYGWSEVPNDVRRQWYEFLLDHRVNPTNIYSSSPVPEFEFTAECVARGMNAFNLRYIGPVRSQEDGQKLTEFLRDYTWRLREQGWFTRAYVYGFDEVQPVGYDAVKQAYSLVRQAVPDLRRACTVVPTRELFGYVDIWVPLTANYNHADAVERRRHGEEVWWYICLSPRHPYANWFIDYPAMEPRLLFWMTWKYGVTGFLYYSLNMWASNRLTEGLPDYLVPHEDASAVEALRQGKRWPEVPWNSYTYSRYNGDGHLLYPGPGGKPVSSVRLECIRDGIEDYDYFWLLDSLANRLSHREGSKDLDLLRGSRRLLTVDTSVVKDLTSFTDEPERLYAARRAVARQIVKLRRALGEKGP